MNERERYLVVMNDGSSMMILTHTFRQVLDIVNDDDGICLISKMDYQEVCEG